MSDEERFAAEVRRQLEAAGVVQKQRHWSRARSQGVWEDPRYTLESTGRMEESRE